jgi:hypothetical protein
MQKMTAPMNLQAPYILANNTTTPTSIVHQIGDSKVSGPSYTTNDVNLLPDAARLNYQEGKLTEDGYLGGF